MDGVVSIVCVVTAAINKKLAQSFESAPGKYFYSYNPETKSSVVAKIILQMPWP